MSALCRNKRGIDAVTLDSTGLVIRTHQKKGRSTHALAIGELSSWLQLRSIPATLTLVAPTHTNASRLVFVGLLFCKLT